ncbi:MAG: malonyl-ACP O-methyltransferase BioC [Methylococcales bacterium]|jgi:malonyl-CoA O-methyltransferase|nr:malonyl-ACP O-methyltransferase BioC [Methylococcales bacterium]MBT7445350.1 malonyl-ACP O-methyltransferase BioC [Methylococcales bacterium]
MTFIDKSRMRRSFDAAASTYDEMAILQHEVGKRVMERLDYIKLEPKRILDIGAGTGRFAHQLNKRYSSAHVIALDIAHAMLRKTQQGNTWRKKVYCVGGDAEQLPIQNDSIDMIFSNLALQWCDDLNITFSDWWRVLNPNGLLMFTTLGPNTLKELRTSWASVDDTAHVNPFMDMHDVGDRLIQAGFSDPVMDCEHITLTYQDIKTLLKELKGIGAHNVMHDQNRGLTGKTAFKQMAQTYETFRDQGVLPATYEVIYGHAWMPPEKIQKNSHDGIETYIPIDRIQKQ